MKSISPDKINRLLLNKQHLTGYSKINDITRIVEDICGLHATNATTPYLSLLTRVPNFRKESLIEELQARHFAKIRCVRGTIYIVTMDMLVAMYVATKNLFQPLSENYLKYMGISLDKYQELAASILKLLEGKGLTTPEITRALGTNTKLSPVINLMCDQALLARGFPKGGWKSNQHTYYLFTEYFPGVDLNEMDEKAAQAKVIRHYIAAFGPVTENDVSWWTGLRKTEVRQALESLQEELQSITVEDTPVNYLMLKSDEQKLKLTECNRERTINLLPGLDPYLMGYRERERYISPAHYEYVFDRSGNATSSILLDGRIAGVWDCVEQKETVIKLFFFDKIENDIQAAIRYEAQKIGRFITGKDVSIKLCDVMIPLTQRSAGSAMSPLKEY